MKRKYSIKLKLMILIGIILASGCAYASQQLSEMKLELINNQEQADKLVFPIIGEVSEVLTIKDYVYVQLATDTVKVWTAVPTFDVKVGDRLVLPGPTMAMVDYKSKLLDKTFGFVYFVPSLVTEQTLDSWNNPEEIPQQAEHPDASEYTELAHNKERLCQVLSVADGEDIKDDSCNETSAKEQSLTQSDLTTLDQYSLENNDTISIAELFNQKEKLAGKQVALQGKVVKYTPKIMGANWLHLQDGTTGTDDLTITTLAEVEMGNLVIIHGVVTLNKDFGAGYNYDVIIENANVSLMAEDSVDAIK